MQDNVERGSENEEMQLVAEMTLQMMQGTCAPEGSKSKVCEADQRSYIVQDLYGRHDRLRGDPLESNFL